MRNKAFRKHKENAKWIRRVKYWMINNSFINDDEGNKVFHPTISDCLKSPQFKIYKDTGSPCSCWMCKFNKYDRNKIKKDTSFLLNVA